MIVDLLVLDMWDLDVIFDNQSTNYTLMDYYKNKVTFQILSEPSFCFLGSRMSVPI